MEISSTPSSQANSLTQQKVGDAVGIKVLEKAMDIQGGSALELVESTSQPSNENLPPHIGQNINVTA